MTDSTDVAAHDDAAVAALLARLDAPISEFPASPDTMVKLAVLPTWDPTTLVAAGILAAGDLPEEALRDPALFEVVDDARRGATRSSLSVALRPRARRDLGRHVRRAIGVPAIGDVLRVLRDELEAVSDDTSWNPLHLPAWRVALQLVIDDPDGATLAAATEPMDRHAAYRLVDTLIPFADVVGGGLPAAIERARTLVTDRYRRQADLRLTEGYLPRPELEDELSRFLGASAGPWGLHLRGEGGVGKSMLLRRLSAGHVAGVPDPVLARIDFDYFDPRYPSEQPVLLLERLEEQLVFRTGATSEIDTIRSRFRSAAASATEAASAGPLALTDPEMVAAVDAFANVLALVRERVILVLDTTEELAKAYGSSGASPAVGRTISLLHRTVEAVAGRVPVKVLFAGRRELEVPVECGRQEDVISVLEVAGFGNGVALAFLRSRLPDRSEDDRVAILERARPRELHGQLRYNPFELRAWADAMLAEPELDVRSISVDDDTYVERRLVARVTEPEARDLLIVVARLGRFDRAMIDAAARRAGHHPEESWEALVDQEWISVVGQDADGRTDLLEVDAHLRERLLVAARHAGEIPDDREALARDLVTLVQPPLRDHRQERFSACARLLATEDGIEWWAQIEAWIAEADAWRWAEAMVPRLEDEVPALAAALRATRAATEDRDQTARSRLWAGVWQLTRTADTGPRAVLRARARLALGATAGGDEPTAVDVELAPFGSVARAAADRVGWRVADGQWSGPIPEWLILAAERLGDGMGLMPMSITAAVHASTRLKEGSGGIDALVTLEAFAWPLGAMELSTSRSAAWVDWHVPPAWTARLALLWAHGHRAADLEAVAEIWRGKLQQITSLASADEERLAAVLLEDLLELDPQQHHLLARLGDLQRSSDLRPRVAESPLQLCGRSLADVLADGWSGIGEPEAAHDVLARQLDAAVNSGQDALAIDDIQRALLRLYRMYRVPEIEWGLELVRIAPRDVAEARAVCGSGRVPPRVTGPQPDRPADLLRHLELQAVAEPAQAIPPLEAFAVAAAGRGELVRSDMAMVLAALARRRALTGPEQPPRLRSDFFRTLLASDEATRYRQPWRDRAGTAGWDVSGLVASTATRGTLNELGSPHAPPKRRFRRMRYPAWSTAMGTQVLIYLAGVVLAARATSGLWSVWRSLALVIAGGACLLASWTMLSTYRDRRRRPGNIRIRRIQVAPAYDRARPDAPSHRYALQAHDDALTTDLKIPGPTARWVRAVTALSPVRADLPFVVVRRRDGASTTAPVLWRLGPVRTRRRKAVVVEIVLDDAELEPMHWERSIADGLAAGKPGVRLPPILWTRTQPGWSDGAVARGPMGYAGPDDLANDRTLSLAETAVHQDRDHVALIVGDVTVTRAGPQILVADSARPSGRSDLLSPSDLAEMAGIVVLQSLPAEGARLFEVDEVFHNWLTLARRVLAAGANAVVLVPPVERRAARAIVDVTTEFADDRDVTPLDVIALTQRIRHHVAAGRKSDDPCTDLVTFVRTIRPR